MLHLKLHRQKNVYFCYYSLPPGICQGKKKGTEVPFGGGLHSCLQRRFEKHEQKQQDAKDGCDVVDAVDRFHLRRMLRRKRLIVGVRSGHYRLRQFPGPWGHESDDHNLNDDVDDDRAVNPELRETVIAQPREQESCNNSKRTHNLRELLQNFGQSEGVAKLAISLAFAEQGVKEECRTDTYDCADNMKQDQDVQPVLGKIKVAVKRQGNSPSMIWVFAQLDDSISHNVRQYFLFLSNFPSRLSHFIEAWKSGNCSYGLIGTKQAFGLLAERRE
jgi:hypothetical protein